ncbi:MAG: DUF1559 domain-containing protein [Gemmatales bacterium]
MFQRLAVLLTTVLLFSVTAWNVPAQQPNSTDASLRLVPDDAILFIHIKGTTLWNNPALEEMKKRLPANKWKKFEKEFFELSEQVTSIPRQHFESTTIILDSWDVPQLPGFAILMNSSVPLEEKRFISGVKKYFVQKFGAASDLPGSRTADGIEMLQVTTFQGKNLFACLLDNKTAAVGDDETLKKLIKRKKQAVGGPLTGLAKAAQGHDVAIGIQLSESLQNQLQALMQMGMAAGPVNGRDATTMRLGFEIIKSLLDIKTMSMQLDMLRDFTLNLQLDANSDLAAVRLQRFCDMLALMGDFGFAHLQELSSSKDFIEMREFRKFFGTLAEACLKGKVTRSGTKVEMALQAQGGGPEFSAAMASALTRVVMSQDRAIRQSNLRQIAIAMHNYHNDYNKLPSAGFYAGMRPTPPAANAKLLFSWRVAILPYLEHDNLFKQFNLNEPWDSEHNKKLIPLMPKFYACPGATDPGVGKTYLQVFVAPEKPTNPQKQMFAPIFRWGGQGLTLGQLTVQDGTSNTMMVAESANAVIWTKPDDMTIEGDDMPLPKLGCVPDETDFFVVFGDASVRAVRRTLDDVKLHERLLRQMIGRRDGRNENTDPIMNETRPATSREFRSADVPLENRK